MKREITPELLREIAAVAETRREETTGMLRARFPGILFTACSEEDVPARLKPVHVTETHAYFLFAGTDSHCLAFTDDFSAAMGVVVATRDGDA
jgi:hypothetical protein